jgi:hypothetical protein
MPRRGGDVNSKRMMQRRIDRLTGRQNAAPPPTPVKRDRKQDDRKQGEPGAA